MSKLMPDVKLHCNIDERAFSKAMFFCRFFTGVSMIYLALGSLLYWREFLVNANALGFPFVVPLSFALVVIELFLGLFLLLGWYTRVNAMLSLLIGLICSVVFFVGASNKIFVVLCMLQVAALCPLCLLGPGSISLDFKRSQRRARRFFRG